MGEEHSDYASYLLRLWKAEENGRPVWLASLESTQTNQREYFAHLEALVRFLQDRFSGETVNSKTVNSQQ